MPPGIVLDEYAALRETMDGLAERFANLFEAHILPDDPTPADISSASSNSPASSC